MSHRFFVDSPITTDAARLSEFESHHFLHVLRGKIGDELIVFDGSGWEFTARAADQTGKIVRLEILDRRRPERESPFPITWGVALPRGDRQRQLVEKAVELGVVRLTPLLTTRSVAQPNEKAISRLERSVIEASKQCGRTCLLDIAAPLSLEDYVQRAPPSAHRLLAHPKGQSISSILSELIGAGEPPSTDVGVFLAIGPEGGFTDAEAQAAAARQWRIVDLGPRILRVETAASFLTALVVFARSMGVSN